MSQILDYVSIEISKDYYRKKFEKISIYEIDWDSRKVAFESLPRHLH